MNDKINLLLHLADTALIISQRQSEWCGHGPVLEQDIAITNISLDLLGQSRNWYQYAARLINETDSNGIGAHVVNAQGLVTEDTLAYLRTEREFKNFILCELPNGDWAQTVLRLYFISTYQQLLFTALQHSADEQIAAIAAKSLKETNYHVRWSSEWVLRLGDGTDESRTRMLAALDALWLHTREFFEPMAYERIGDYTPVAELKDKWLTQTNELLQEATLPNQKAIATGWTGLRGKDGVHTEHMGYILTELQYLQRTYPNAEW